MSGRQLFEDLVKKTGLPQKLISTELENIIQSSGKNIETLTIEDLRSILANYLQDVLVDAKKEFDRI